MGIDLFDDCGPSAADCDFSKIEINQEYAKRLEHNKRREALQRYEDYRKRGLDGDSSESSDDSSGDEAGNPSAKEVLQFFDAIARIKKKDPILLQKDTKLFSSSSSEEEEEEEKKKPRTARKEKPLYLKDVMARQLIEDGPEFEEEPLRKNPKVYSTKQVEGIKAFLEAEKEAFGSGNDDDNDIFRLKKSGGNYDEDEGFVGEIQKKADEIFEEDDNDLFLKFFLLNKVWAENEKDERPFDDIGISEDDDELEKQDKYEAEYNFRHEEAQDDRVLGHSRITECSVRKKSSSRKAQRKNKEERMMQAEIERKEELKHMKNLKKKEIQEKLDRIRVIAGIGEDDGCNLDASHLEEDFDPEKYDRTMKAMFGVDYYNADDADLSFGSDADNDTEKPDFDKEDKLLGLQKDWDSVDTMEGFEALRKMMSGKNKEMEEPTQGQGKNKREQKISLREKVELDKELEDYYKLDYEGTVGDLKTRFKYRSVPPNSYGLHTEEILMANDKDLNQYVSLKRLASFKEEWKVTYHQKLKKSLILRGVKLDSKTSIMKHGTRKITNSTNADKKVEYKEANGDANNLSKRGRKRRMHAQLKLSKSRLIAYGKISSKYQKNKRA